MMIWSEHQLIALITNQSDIARGFFTAADVEMVHQRLATLLAEENAWFDGTYFCPHHSEENCRCRKPAPGLVEQAAREHGFDPRKSLIVGDNICDLELGWRVGSRTILVRTGYGCKVEKMSSSLATNILNDVSELPDLLWRLEEENRERIIDQFDQGG